MAFLHLQQQGEISRRNIIGDPLGTLHHNTGLSNGDVWPAQLTTSAGQSYYVGTKMDAFVYDTLASWYCEDDTAANCQAMPGSASTASAQGQMPTVLAVWLRVLEQPRSPRTDFCSLHAAGVLGSHARLCLLASSPASTPLDVRGSRLGMCNTPAAMPQAVLSAAYAACSMR